MALAGPFYWAWVEPTETVFGPEHHRMDEYIFSAKRTLAEGEKPLLEIELQNPHIGILSAGRKYWAWFAWDNGTSIVPLFFGRVVGTPVHIFEEVFTLQLVADPIDYQQRVQRVAETLKYQPFYDPVFIDVGQRDDPNTILEAHAKVWDVDPVTHAVTANDILVGDENEDFTEVDHFYDGMQMTVGQPPATAILMDASVNWSQTARGIVDFGARTINSMGGDGLIGEWPKPGAQIGGGWSVYYSDAYDSYGSASAATHTVNWSYNNTQKRHAIGDVMSVQGQSTTVMGHVGASVLLTDIRVIGKVDPFAVDGDGDPAPINRPGSVTQSTAAVMAWSVVTSLVLQYDAERKRTERVIFLVRADTQPVLVDPTLDETSEVMTKSGADVGAPIVNLLNWTTIAGTAVAVGQVIFPDNPDIPGGKSAQICVTAGTAGMVTPAFSDVPGVTTADGSVTWSSLGQATPPDNASGWTGISHVNAGTVILPKRSFYTTWTSLILPALRTNTATSISVTEGQIIQSSNGSYQVCTLAGEILLVEPAFSTVWGTVTPDNTAEWTSLGMHLPSGSAFHIATTAGTSGPMNVIPSFDETLHGTTTDGSVVWTCIGSGDIPAGGVPGEIHTPTYFATDRGRASLEYLAALVRAKLLYRSRCVEISFDCEYGRGVGLSTRKTVTLHDHRIAGGVALGKIKTAVLQVSDSGVANCQVTLACAAGRGNAVDEQPGDPGYVAAGYVDEYQQYDNVTVVLPTTTDLGYAPPVYVASDDNLSFPLNREDVLVTDLVHYTGNQMGAVVSALNSMRIQANKNLQPKPGTNPMAEANTVPNAIKNNPVWQEFQIKPVTGGPYNKVYNVKFSNLAIPMGIDLQSSTVT